MIEVRAIAVLRMTDDRGQDDKIICVPYEDPHWSDLEDLDDIPAQLRDARSSTSSRSTSSPRGSTSSVQGFAGCEDARAVIEDARERFSSRDRA